MSMQKFNTSVKREMLLFFLFWKKDCLSFIDNGMKKSDWLEILIH